ncbi:dubious [Schizosaccharomyces pombe]|uniref:Putative uncharacterized transmembrane protein C1235.18 n=1 Tax=Schizosaccharomyces pombe (strain 972 / ATCC 24843) TaxID=284812 RepID=YCYI_SCHPO|nr:uncharacterized protein SPCC1235.18 [Schizosaccharomyces pombe]G2TRT8.1 RecName: Full=Putative uncharacterized transmembrane protein C1235.18 [Schizosaccharomyces pombe 972h-]CCD31390.1 dubious [Schizosaccharomyces pombe]|eukprot:NP_001343180.1 uncharacterized protein SPCC1235.18 [Schizosaccharomyces pombe]
MTPRNPSNYDSLFDSSIFSSTLFSSSLYHSAFDCSFGISFTIQPPIEYIVLSKPCFFAITPLLTLRCNGIAWHDSLDMTIWVSTVTSLPISHCLIVSLSLSHAFPSLFYSALVLSCLSLLCLAFTPRIPFHLHSVVCSYFGRECLSPLFPSPYFTCHNG